MKKNNIIQGILGALLILLLSACGAKKAERQNNVEMISDGVKQELIFRSLVQLTNNTLSEDARNDSLAFLILPMEASCPECRTKVIDSLVDHQTELIDGRFIIISANAGRKTISSFFREQNKELPIIENRLFIDSTNQGLAFGLFETNPTIYYTNNGKAYKKVNSLPSTVREDLHSFFSDR